ncbi:MAG TPA: helix-turn-helix domain-containing protein [Streptosporangiaceae bacterium]|jgi:hypothetical protein
MAAATELIPVLYTVPEALTMLRMSRTYFYGQVNAGRLHIVKQGAGTRVTADDMAAYVALLKREAEAAR